MARRGRSSSQMQKQQRRRFFDIQTLVFIAKKCYVLHGTNLFLGSKLLNVHFHALVVVFGGDEKKKTNKQQQITKAATNRIRNCAVDENANDFLLILVFAAKSVTI